MHRKRLVKAIEVIQELITQSKPVSKKKEIEDMK